MSTKFRRASLIVLLGSCLSGCAPLGRFEDTERLAAKTATELKVVQAEERERDTRLQEDLVQLKNRLEGVSSATIRVPAGDVPAAIFGNHSGQNATATITHRADDFKGPGTAIRIVRVNRPRDAALPPPSPVASAPDFAGIESTAWLELSPAGSRRQMVVPCGYQLEARSASGATIDLLIKYQNKECQ